MKIEIESEIIESRVSFINEIILIAKSETTLQSAYFKMNSIKNIKKVFNLCYTGSHIWVSNRINKRVLLITG